MRFFNGKHQSRQTDEITVSRNSRALRHRACSRKAAVNSYRTKEPQVMVSLAAMQSIDTQELQTAVESHFEEICSDGDGSKSTKHVSANGTVFHVKPLADDQADLLIYLDSETTQQHASA
jgi:hypothetical protein